MGVLINLACCLYADEDVLVLDKPAGLLCVPGRGPDKQDCLSARVQQHWPTALIVHRLDQATSGLVIMALHPSAQRHISDAFALRRVEKHYRATVQGVLAPTAQGLIDLPIGPDWPRRPRQKVDFLHGKPSQTRWQVLHSDPEHGTTEVQLQPLTGRTHQLRLHLAAIGHPIVGDALYADYADSVPNALNALNTLNVPTVANLGLGPPRLRLHACALGLHHPRTQVWHEWFSPVPWEAEGAA